MHFYAATSLGSTAAISASIIFLDAKKYYIKTPPYESIILEVRYPLDLWFLLPSRLSFPSPVGQMVP